MDEIKINTENDCYSIYLGNDNLKNIDQYITKDYSSIVIITDENVAKLYLKDVQDSLKKHNVFVKVIKSGEQSKTIDGFYELHSFLIESGCDRNSVVIALGGGVVGDLAGFVAATYMRGIDYIQLPTTILAHDSSVGGKVAINHPYGKNLIGNFYTPRFIMYDIKTFQSLPLKEIRSGYAELIKEALIADESFFSSLLANPVHPLNPQLIQNHIRKGIFIKASIVEQDEKENGIRKHLNFGHTLGHALETYFNYKVLSHGEAVAVGILFSLYMSEKLFDAKLPTEKLYAWLMENNYPLNPSNLNYSKLIKIMKSDKKAINASIHMVLLRNIGQPMVYPINDQELAYHMKNFFEKLGSDLH